MQEFHVTPVFDSKPHSAIIQCSCEPELLIGEDGLLVVIHHLFDGGDVDTSAQDN